MSASSVTAFPLVPRRRTFLPVYTMPLVQKVAEVAVYFTDQGIEELGERRGEDEDEDL
jgi:hypothetical protein